jgi:hypothetical protein
VDLGDSVTPPEIDGVTVCAACLYALAEPVRSEYRPVASLALLPTVVGPVVGSAGGRHRIDRLTVTMPVIRARDEEPVWPTEDPDVHVSGSGYLPGMGDGVIAAAT